MAEESEPEDGRPPRTAKETAERVLGLLAVIGRVHEDAKTITAWVSKHEIKQFLSPAEAAFFQKRGPSIDERSEFSWRAEAVVSLIWALKGLSEMPPLNQQFDIFQNELVKLALKAPRELIAQAQLRSAEEINAMESYLSHQHWRVHYAELIGLDEVLKRSTDDDPPIEELDHGIVFERRYGLSWLVGWGNDWDDVPTE
jgi:hypothetical protein